MALHEEPSRQRAPFGRSKVDGVVMDFFARVGVDPAYVVGYTVDRSNAGSMINVKFVFDDEPAEAGEGGQ